MADHRAKAEDFEKKAEKKLSGWSFLGSKHEDAADLFDKAANSFKLAKSCSKFYFSDAYILLADFQLIDQLMVFSILLCFCLI